MIAHIKSLDGTPIGYQRSGAGAPLVLVHGATANHKRWDGVAPHFSRHFSVYAMDRRGRGLSGDSPDYDLLREAEDVAAVVEAASAQDGEPVAVLGHSYGGLVALEAALLTGKIGALVLYEPAMPSSQPKYGADFRDRFQALIERGELESALVMFLREGVKMPEHELAHYRTLPMWPERIELAPTLFRELQVAETYQFEASRFAELRVPVLLLVGGDSPADVQQASESVANALPESRVAVMPGQQHIAMDTDPELFVKEVLQFLPKEAAQTHR